MMNVSLLDKNKSVIASFSNEVTGFTLLTRNNEGTTFSASVPSLSAQIELSVLDDYSDLLKQCRFVQVYTTGQYTITLKVIEYTYVKRKGAVEISC